MTSEYRIVILPEAQRDLREIALYITTELESPQAALNTIVCIESAITKLKILPERVKPINEQPWCKQGVRKIQVKNFYVYYIVIDDAVNVMSVVYARRDQKRRLDDLYGPQ